MKVRNIPSLPILEFLGKLERGEIKATYESQEEDAVDGIVTWFPSWGVVWAGAKQSVQHAMPAEVRGNEKRVRRKMQSLKDQGLITGCCCGCRGDFELTDKGRSLLVQRKPSTLAQQVADAKAESASWSPEKRASVRLEGGDQP